MDKRRTKGWFGERGSIGRPLFGRLCSVSRRSVPSALLLLAVALLPCARAWGGAALFKVNTEGANPLLSHDEATLRGYFQTSEEEVLLWQRYAIRKRLKRKRGVP